MATGTLILPVAGAVLPDGSTSNDPAQFIRTKSSAAAPASHFVEALFDATNEESIYIGGFRMPQDYAFSPVIKLLWKANTTSGAVTWGVMFAAITPGDADTPNEHALGSANTQNTSVNTTEARRLVETSVTITNADSVAAGDLLFIRVYRAPGDAGDTCTVDAELTAVSLEYTTT